ncbi:hypothetical protein KAU15_02185 [candidate division WOR-3 bacterium]|nr:hypothetical protein [candidate division WOR-3 bacterium]
MNDKLIRLVSQFKEHYEEYKSASYDESNTRTDFIDKFFECMYNAININN